MSYELLSRIVPLSMSDGRAPKQIIITYAKV